MTSSAKCADAKGQVELRLQWFNADGVAFSTTSEKVIPGVDWSEQFLWRRAPEQAQFVSVELERVSECEWNMAGLYQLS